MNDAPINIRGATLAGQQLVLEHPQQSSVILGSTLTDCTLEFRQSARALTLANSRFLGCSLVAKKPQRNHQFFTVEFTECRFVGDFSGCEFGGRGEPKDRKAVGNFTDCGFREADIHLCTFTGKPVSAVTLPPWPYAAILNPRENAAKFQELVHVLPNAETIAAFLARIQAQVSFITLDFSEKGYAPVDELQALELQEILTKSAFAFVSPNPVPANGV